MRVAPFVAVAFCLALIAQAAQAQNCHHVDPSAERPLGMVTLPPPHGCYFQASNGYPMPDRFCTPGAINPTVTIEVLRDPKYRTGCIRDSGTSAAQKAATYDWYNVKHPPHNTSANQTCELDHLISLELGGADTLDNIWPQCGPPGVVLFHRYFKQKDMVENYLAAQVKAGTVGLADAQRGLATDWTQYVAAAQQYYAAPAARVAVAYHARRISVAHRGVRVSVAHRHARVRVAHHAKHLPVVHKKVRRHQKTRIDLRPLK